LCIRESSNSKHEEVSDNDAIDFIIGAIDAGNPVLVGMKKDSGSGTHFVAAYGYNGSTIYIHDPASGRDYTTLDKYLESYCVNRLYVYTN
ncbi:MAG: C39 family peptidase, partial [Lachnospiraceae bacterium]|nr:C39 family peptidase [Lachnospiraceae bacterium]